MNVDQQIDQEQRLVVLTITGRMNDGDLLSLADRVEKDEAISRDFGLVMDMRLADGDAITTEGVRALASRRLALNASSRRAVVVPSGLGYGMARMYQMLRTEGSPNVFTDYDAAYRWAATGRE